MLTHLAIKDLALIDRLEVSFGPGLNILSGETGAGKSIILGAVQLLLGGRAQTDLIRQGAEEAVVEGLMDLPESGEVVDLLKAADLHTGPDLLLVRLVSATGRSRAYVNGRLVNLGLLAEIGSRLLSISGQHEAQRLLRPEEHLNLLDAFGGLETQRAQVTQAHAAWRGLMSELERLRQLEAGKQEKLDLFAFQAEELERARLRSGEEAELVVEQGRLRHAQRLSAGAGQAYQAIYGDDHSAATILGQARNELSRLTDLDPSLAPLLGRLEEAGYLIEEAGRDLLTYAENVVFDSQRQEEVEDRLALLARLRRKHAAPDEAALLAKAEWLAQELARLKDLDLALDRLEAQASQAEADLLRLAGELSRRRVEAGARLTMAGEVELNQLSLSGARFQVARMDKPVGPDGVDKIQFLLSANPGEEPRPLAKVASGGELSRITLALKSLLAGQGGVETVVFDEVDAGIGGRVAEVVGRKLLTLAGRQQVLCITHLPQIAAFGQRHYRVTKAVDGGRSISRIDPLEPEERVQELARMLAGATVTETALDHARELLAGARS